MINKKTIYIIAFFFLMMPYGYAELVFSATLNSGDSFDIEGHPFKIGIYKKGRYRSLIFSVATNPVYEFSLSFKGLWRWLLKIHFKVLCCIINPTF